MQLWTEDVFNCRKPIIAMCHFGPLPGDPLYGKKEGMKKVIDWATRDLASLQEGGVDAVMFSNEFSFPYLTRVDTVTVAAMARVIGELMPRITVPFGVNVLSRILSLLWTWRPLRAPDSGAGNFHRRVRQ